MKLSKEDQHYDEQWDIVDTFFNTNDPQGFGAIISAEEAEALRSYYFVKPQEHDVYVYREQITKDNPRLVEKAKSAAGKIATAEGLDYEKIKQIFS